MKKLFVIFVNFNSGKQLNDGVNFAIASPSVTGVIVVDNDSNDSSLENLKIVSYKNRVTIIKNNENLGFYKALNMGIDIALKKNADMVMPMDFDLDFSFDFISKLVKIDADIVAPALKSRYNNIWFYVYGGRVDWVKGKALFDIKKNPLNNIGIIYANVKFPNSNLIDFVSGGCTIIKRSVIDKIGFFDEDYFVYWGDVDYSLKARENGFNVAIAGNTIVHHKLEIAIQTNNYKKLKISFFDNLTFINKRIKWYYKPIAYLYIFILVFKVLLRQNPLV